VIPILVPELAGIPRRAEPVTLGLPFPPGAVANPAALRLRSPAGAPVPVQASVLDRWPDGTVKWALLDFLADVAPHATAEYTLGLEGGREATEASITVDRVDGGVEVDTGAARFRVDGEDVIDPTASGWVLQDGERREHRPRVDRVAIETAGPIRTTLRVDGSFVTASAGPASEFTARLTFLANRAMTRLALTVRNPRRARHARNLWDLGDPGSVYIRDLALRLTLAGREPTRVLWSAEPDMPVMESPGSVEIYQDSSGGLNWDSPNHVNRQARVTTVFRGYRADSGDDPPLHGHRAQPLVTLAAGDRSLSIAVPHFWQNFPKAIESTGRSLLLGLFPRQASDLHELQGGEQKTHTVYLEPGRGGVDPLALAWTRQPLVPHATPAWYAATGAIPCLTPRREGPDVNPLERAAGRGPAGAGSP
jgi:hypothetical protein